MLKEVKEVVDKLNDKIIDELPEEVLISNEFGFSYFSFGYVEDEYMIEWGNQVLWYSGEDERYYDDEKDEYESLYDFVVKKFEAMWSIINMINKAITAK